jgi:hypothetical protein
MGSWKPVLFPVVHRTKIIIINFTYIDANNCENYAAENIVVDPYTGIANIPEEEISIKPYPAKEMFWIETHMEIDKYKSGIFL